MQHNSLSKILDLHPGACVQLFVRASGIASWTVTLPNGLHLIQSPSEEGLNDIAFRWLHDQAVRLEFEQLRLQVNDTLDLRKRWEVL
jgi:hypothetical protein